LLTTSLGEKLSDAHVEMLVPPCWHEGAWLRQILKETEPVAKLWQHLWNDESGQDIAEYAVMLAVILVIVVGTVRLIGSNANNVFSNVGSAIQ
jgi:Flp pilus assembly pilin Flp